METVWKLKKTPINDAQELAEQLVIPVPVANVMIQRGIDTPELAREFFDLSPEKLHDPWLLPDIHKVIDRLEKAINELKADIDSISLEELLPYADIEYIQTRNLNESKERLIQRIVKQIKL